MNPSKIILGTIAYFASSFVIQGMLAFAVAGEYFMSIPIMRPNPILFLVMPATVLVGIALAILYPRTNFEGTPVVRGLKFGLLTALIIVPFVAMDLPGRFAVPSVEKWVLIQGTLGILHCSIAGVLIGLVYGKHGKES